MKHILLLSVLLFFSSNSLMASKLQVGFLKSECAEMLKISLRTGDTLYDKSSPAPEKFNRVYRSSEVGLINRWDLWTSPDSIAVLSIRGSTTHVPSWIENCYFAMVPAKGSIHLSDTQVFDYQVSTNDEATVHAGWLIGAVCLFRDMVPKVDSCMEMGINDIYITGHSQGGAIATLTTSLWHHLIATNDKYKALRLKTYTSASPKVGNLYYAYEYEALTQEGWSFNLVNSADWVPELPFSVQTTEDFNETNPFTNIGSMLNLVAPKGKTALKYVYKQLDKSTKNANKKLNTYFGKFIGKQINNYYPDYQAPSSYGSSNYVRTGHTIVLLADASYFEAFPYDETKLFQHHMAAPYFYLLERL